jgi:pimeloyl-ACP methyl ester carboxylesterase
MKGALQTEFLPHGRVALALHTLQHGPGPRLLLLHPLRGSSAEWGEATPAWPGEVFALDFSGHGESDWLPGRGYAPEVYVAEADMAIARLESPRALYLAGAGIGAYVALLLAGARADRIRATLLLPGAGLRGGGAHPGEVDAQADADWRHEVSAAARLPGEPSPDPLVRRCTRDVRPRYYVEAFARGAGRLLIADLTDPPCWLTVVRQQTRTQPVAADPREAFRALADC